MAQGSAASRDRPAEKGSRSIRSILERPTLKVKPNLLDRAISAISPERGLKRIRARAASEVLTRGYEGASVGRDTDGWISSAGSSDVEIGKAGYRLRERSRDLVRNDPYALKAVDVLVSNIIGEGIVPRPVTGDKDKDKLIRAAFDHWARNECDADGQLDFYGMQALMVAEMIEGGEALMRRRNRFSNDGMRVPLQLQIMEAEQLDPLRNGPVANGGGSANGFTVQGVEFNLIGQRTGYWLYPYHPGSNFLDPRAVIQSRWVPAQDIVHLYEKRRTQVRGVPWCHSVIVKHRSFGDYDEAELVRKKIEASVAGFVTSNDDEEEGIAPKVTDADGNLIEQFEPGIIAYLRGGKDIKFNSPSTVGGYAEYTTVQLRAIAAGWRIPYELISNDLTNVNYSSIRAGVIEFRRQCRRWQWNFVIPMALDVIWDWWCESAYAAGIIPDREVPVRWAPPKFEYINPSDDADAEMTELRGGVRSFQEIVSAQGRDPEEVLDEIEKWNDELDRRGIILDSDPRNTSGRGMIQKNGSDGKSLPQPDGKPVRVFRLRDFVK